LRAAYSTANGSKACFFLRGEERISASSFAVGDEGADIFVD
jgi:hypothetical protein